MACEALPESAPTTPAAPAVECSSLPSPASSPLIKGGNCLTCVSSLQSQLLQGRAWTLLLSAYSLCLQQRLHTVGVQTLCAGVCWEVWEVQREPSQLSPAQRTRASSLSDIWEQGPGSLSPPGPSLTFNSA